MGKNGQIVMKAVTNMCKIVFRDVSGTSLSIRLIARADPRCFKPKRRSQATILLFWKELLLKVCVGSHSMRCTAPGTMPAQGSLCREHLRQCCRRIQNLSLGRKFATASAKSCVHRKRRSTVRTTSNATESSHQDQPQTAQKLREELDDAIKIENYQKAAELRDALQQLQLQQPKDTAFALKKKMDQYVAQDRFEVSLCFAETLLSCKSKGSYLQAVAAAASSTVASRKCLLQEAAAVRDQLRAVVQKNIEEAQKRTTSDAVTEGIRVQVKRYSHLGVLLLLCCSTMQSSPLENNCLSEKKLQLKGPLQCFGILQLLCAKPVIPSSEAVLLCIFSYN